MALTPLHIHNVCYGNSWTSGAQPCKYIDHVTRSDGQHVAVCTKLNAGAYADLQKRRGGFHTPTGDNCRGYLFLQYKEQGYDKK